MKKVITKSCKKDNFEAIHPALTLLFFSSRKRTISIYDS